MNAIVVRAYAKVNLTLEVLNRRADGYHELRSVVQTIDLYDELTVEPATGEAVRDVVQAPDTWSIPAGRQNLAFRARDLYLERLPGVGRSAASNGARIDLRKAIPPAAGLGGGSSDAAAVLRAMALLAPGPAATKEHLHALAGELGSDVPFFLEGGTQCLAGRGERLEVLPDLPETWVVLVTPPLGAPGKTSRLFGLLAISNFSSGSATRDLMSVLSSGGRVRADLLANAFDRVATEAFPDLQPYRSALRKVCGHALLCGAGPSLFALAEGEAAAQAAVAALGWAGIDARGCRTVGAAGSTASTHVGRRVPDMPQPER